MSNESSTASGPEPARTVLATRSTLIVVPGSASSRSHNRSTTLSSTWAARRPALPALLRKMSPKRGDSTALKPWFCKAQTACSRDEPVPKSGPATSTEPAAYAGRLRTKVGSLRHAANSPSSKPVRVTRLRYTAGMIWSVSTLLRRSGTPMPVWLVNASMSGLLALVMVSTPLDRRGGDDHRREVRRRAERAADRRRGRDRDGDQVGATALA